MRNLFVAALLCCALPAGADWRDEVVALVQAGRAADAIDVAERARTPWLAPHLARRLPAPTGYVGWVAGTERVVAYGRTPTPWALDLAATADVETAVAALRAAIADGTVLPAGVLAALRRTLFERLPPAPRVRLFATDGALSRLPFAALGATVVHALSERSAALAAFRTEAARRRPPTLFAFARSAVGDPGALPAARAEIELAAAALGGGATLLGGAGAFARLQTAVYDGTLTGARYVLVAAHAVPRDGAVALALDDGDGALFAPADTLHLQLTAELVVLSACETGSGTAFAEAGARAGAGMTLLTHWRVDDAASAQFVAALFAELGRGSDVPQALRRVQQAFARGDHGDQYRHPYHWSGWQLWGGV